MQLATEKIPIPAPNGGPNRTRKYRFDLLVMGGPPLEITDKEMEGLNHPWQTISTAARQYGKQHGGKFVTRRVNDGYLVWRTE